MTIFLGIFRPDRWQYHPYTVFFNDVSGLEKKADVKIAGVKVGWVEKIILVDDNSYQARATIMVHKYYLLYLDAQAVVRQEGLLGAKYVELLPGNPALPQLSIGKSLITPGKSPASIDSILHTVAKIAHNLEGVTDSLQENFGGLQGKKNLNVMITDFKDMIHHMKEAVPSIKESIERVSGRIDKDLGTVANRLESTALALEDAAVEARNGFKNIGSVAQKIDNGTGLIGKLINEDETYHDIKVTVQSLKKYFHKVDNLNIVFDSHGEYMYRPAENVNFEDAKGYLDIRIHPNDDHFYLFQYVMTQRGNIKRSIQDVRWYDEQCVEFLPSELIKQGVAIPELVGKIERRKRTLDKAKFGAQVGKIYKDFAFRIGFIESSAGFGVDFHIPFGTDKFRWITTFEAFDFKGRDRFDDKRPHLKWINRLFLLRNLYMAFGADDFISKENANGFFGAGIRFCDEDIKYLFAQLGFAGFN
ncbi:MAG: MlaD family protein [Candidatus Babeliales bacterium]